MIYIGDKRLKTCFLGDEEIKKVYHGDSLVFKARKPSRLPEGYTEVEYIESSGKQYINTGKKPISTTKISIDIEPISEPTSSIKYFFNSSYWPAGNATVYLFFSGFSTKGIIIGTYSRPATQAIDGSKVLSSDTTLRRMVITIDVKKKTASIEGENSITISPAISTSLSTIRIGSSDTVKFKLYSCQIYSGSGQPLVRDFVPCIDPSGAVGLYDLVESKFYGNAGTSGSFTAGPAV